MRPGSALILLLYAMLSCGRGPVPRVETRREQYSPVQHAEADAVHLNLRGCKLRDLAEYDSAMYFFRSALELGRKNQLGMRMAAALQNMGTVYSDRAYDFSKYNHEADLESAAACYDTALRILSDSGKDTRMPSVLTDMAIAYFRDPKYQKRADSLFQQARGQAHEHGMVFDEGLVLYHQGQLHANQAVDARSLPRLCSAVLLLDTAAILLRRANQAQTAGSAEQMAEDMRQAIQEIEQYENSRKGGDK